VEAGAGRQPATFYSRLLGAENRTLSHPAMGRIVKRVGKSFFIIGFFSFVFFFLFVFLPLFCGIVSSGGALVERPGLTCYPYHHLAYTLSFPSPEERAETIL
jgi:hypothetical protein